MQHTLYTCPPDCERYFCNYCVGGLAFCTVCGGAEGSLPTHCPRRRISPAVLNIVYAGQLNFRDNEWRHEPNSPWHAAPPPPPAVRYILLHAEYGVYLGSALGLGFWSHGEQLGLDEAPTFASHLEAAAYVASWEQPLPFELLPLAHAEAYVTLDAVVQAGGPGWVPCAYFGERQP